MNDPLITLVARLHAAGRDVETIARRVNRPRTWVENVLEETATKEEVTYVEREGQATDTGDEIWTDEQIRFHINRLTPKAFRAVEGVLDDPDASASAKLKASDMMWKYQAAMVDNTKVDDDKATNFMMTDEQMQLLLRMEKELGE